MLLLPLLLPPPLLLLQLSLPTGINQTNPLGGETSQGSLSL